MTQEILYYDVISDEMKPLTQEKFDEYVKFVRTVKGADMAIEEARPHSYFQFRLAVYPNRDGMVFVAESRSIEPYAGVRNLDGSLCYPPVPQKGYSLGSPLPREFAFELVRRWNLVAEQENSTKVE
jgi:hypothetical protein